MSGLQSDFGRSWSVYRQDDNGNQFVVERGLARQAAAVLAATLEARGHKQLYWIEPDNYSDRTAPSRA
jgi:hypothetical protein